MPLRHLIVAFAVVAAVPAAAAEPTASAAPNNAMRTETARLLEEQRNFELADVDGDGVMSWEEFRNFFVPQFFELDKNGDGVIGGAEHPPARGADGKPVSPPDVSIEAFQHALESAFKSADRDGSGTLSAREWATPLK